MSKTKEDLSTMTEEVLCNETLLYSKKQAARILNVSEKTVDRLIKKGRLSRISGYRRVLIPFKALEMFVSNNTFYNRNGVESVLSHTGESLCDSISVKASTKLPTNQQVENRLDALLKPLKRE